MATGTIAAGVIASMLILGGASGLRAEEVFVTIGGGDFTGVYLASSARGGESRIEG